MWTYTLDGTVGLAQFNIITDSGSGVLIGRTFGPGLITVEPEYQARFRAQATNTRAELNILQVQRSDEATYRMNVIPTGFGSLSQLVVVIVSCKCICDFSFVFCFVYVFVFFCIVLFLVFLVLWEGGGGGGSNKRCPCCFQKKKENKIVIPSHGKSFLTL